MTDSSTTTNRFGGFVSVLAFLSIIPVPAQMQSRVGLRSAARHMHLFPVIGGIIGSGAGLLAWGLFEVVEPLVAGLLISAVLLVITGLHHTDGLADMADGMMVRGTHRRKLEAMKDRHTGTAGIAAVIFCIAGLIITLSLAGQEAGADIVSVILVAEVLAKFSMVLMAAAGSPAGRGTGALFADAMKSDRRKLAASGLTAVVVVAVFGGGEWLQSTVLVAVSVVIPMILIQVARYNFGGITGDVIGATNDIVRVAVLAVFVSV